MILCSFSLGLDAGRCPRHEEPKVLKDTEVFLKMILDEVSKMVLNEGKSRALLDPNISLVMLGEEESSLKLRECWQSDGKEDALLCFKVDAGSCDRTSRDKSNLESKMDGLLILKKDLKRFEVDSNLEEVT